MTAQSTAALYDNHKGLIKSTIRRNRRLLNALHLEDDDVAQELSIAMLSAIERFKPERDVPLAAYVSIKLQYAILDMKRRFKPHGVTGVPQNERLRLIRLDAERPEGGTYEVPVLDDTGVLEFTELFESLSERESNVIKMAAQGYPVKRKAQADALGCVRKKYNQIYSSEGSIAA